MSDPDPEDMTEEEQIAFERVCELSITYSEAIDKATPPETMVDDVATAVAMMVEDQVIPVLLISSGPQRVLAWLRLLQTGILELVEDHLREEEEAAEETD